MKVKTKNKNNGNNSSKSLTHTIWLVIRYFTDGGGKNYGGWAFAEKEPPDIGITMGRARLGRSPHHERKCHVCGRFFWTSKKDPTCHRLKCFLQHWRNK